MTGFKPRVSGVGSDRSTATTTSIVLRPFSLESNKIDRIYSSAHKRALQSAKLVLAELEKTIPVHIMHQIHEVGGVYMKGKTFPGLNENEVKEIIPDIVIGQGFSE